MPRSTSEADRWAAATEELDRRSRGETVESRRRLTRQVDRWLTGSVVILLTATSIAGSSWAVPAGHPSPVLGALGWTSTAAGLAVQVVGLVLVVRASTATGRTGHPLALLDRNQRRQLRHQLHGRAPLDPRRLGLVRWLAEQETGVHAQLVSSCGMATWFVALGREDGAGRQIAGAAFVLLCLVGCAWAVSVARRARRFLATHPEPSPVLP